MARLDEITDFATLQQAATLLEVENARLHTRLTELIAELAQLRGQDGERQLSLELAKLQDQVAHLQRKLFGTSSEKRPKDDEKAAKAEKDSRRGHGPRPQPELPIEPVDHEVDDADRICGLCGDPMEDWEGQTEDSDEVTVVQRSFKIIRHQRKKCRCPRGCSIVTAPPPPKLMAGGHYSVDFAVHAAVQKYDYHLPLERQVRIYGQEGLVIDSQTLWDQLYALYGHLRPSYEALGGAIFARPIIHADETHWWMLEKGPGKKWYVWTVASTDAVYHRIFPSRSGATAIEVLGGYDGRVLVDGYAAYQTAARGKPGQPARFTLAFCWTHVRRAYVEAEPTAPACAVVIEHIGELFAIERELPDPHALDGEDRQAALEHIREVRRQRSAPITEAILTWARTQAALPESRFRKAIEYMLGLWPGLTRFLDDPWIPLSNNLVERQIRPVVVGRKNHYGSKSKRGTEVAALFYSLIETARMRGEDPATYLRRAAYAAIAIPGTVTLPDAPG